MLPYYTFSDYYVPRLYQTLLATISVIIREVFSSAFTEDFYFYYYVFTLPLGFKVKNDT